MGLVLVLRDAVLLCPLPTLRLPICSNNKSVAKAVCLSGSDLRVPSVLGEDSSLPIVSLSQA
jgi:hypothetical protein